MRSHLFLKLLFIVTSYNNEAFTASHVSRARIASTRISSKKEIGGAKASRARETISRAAAITKRKSNKIDSKVPRAE